jgi:hypothetical protein
MYWPEEKATQVTSYNSCLFPTCYSQVPSKSKIPRLLIILFIINTGCGKHIEKAENLCSFSNKFLVDKKKFGKILFF